jgi:phosphate transport system permease protein
MNAALEAPAAGRPALPQLAEPESAWSPIDRLGVGLAWAAGLLLCLIIGAILIYMMVKGLRFLSLDLLTTHPVAATDQSKSGGILDPIEGTLIVTAIGTLIALPVGVAIAVWLAEYGRPAWLARAVESGVEIVAGTPTIVLAIFGFLLFTQPAFGFLSFTAQGHAVFGRSFFVAGIMMSLIAIPLVVGATRESLQSIPAHVREASYALGKDRAATIRRVLLPGSRAGIATGTTLGMGRIIGDTAIIVILLGATAQLQPYGGAPVVKTLRGTGSTLTSYVYNNSPVGEGNAPDKAYAAAFVLLAMIVLMNLVVNRFVRRSQSPWR